MGASYGDLFGGDAVVGYHFTADPNFRQLAEHAVDFAATLPWHDVFTVSANYATVNPDLPAPLNLHGFSEEIAPRYSVTLRPMMTSGDRTQ